jgi:hypothetical protein
LTNTIAGVNQLNLRTPTIANGTATNGQILGLINAANGTVDFISSSSSFSTNIYNSDGTIISPRSVDLSTNSLNFNGASGQFLINTIGQIAMSAKTNIQYASEEAQVGGGQRFKVFTPRFGAGAAQGHVLTMLNAANGLADFHPANNLYSSNGIIAGNRIVDANFRDLSLTNVNVFDLRGRTSTISGDLQLNLRTPKVVLSTAVNNQVLTLLDATTGRADYAGISFPADRWLQTDDVNIPASTLRYITIPTNSRVIFQGSGGFLQGFNLGLVDIAANSNHLYGATEVNLTAPAGKLRIQPPRVPGSATAGMVLTALASDGEADWYSPTNFYFQNGALSGTRTITGGGNSIVFNGINTYYIDSTNFTVFGKSSINLATPKIFNPGANGAAANGWVFTLQDTVSGRGEWGPQLVPTNTPVTIYTGDGVLLGPRVVSQNNFNLDFNVGTGRFQVFNANQFVTSGKTNDLFSSDYMRLGAVTNLIINTPRLFKSSAAAMAGQVLMLAANGTVDYQPIATNGVDVSIYSQDGNLQSDRTVTGAGRFLAFTNISDFSASATNATLQGTGRLSLKTPLYASRQNQFLQLVDQATGAVEFGTPTDISIYNNNGTITGTRLVTLSGGAQLIFSGSGVGIGNLIGTSLSNAGFDAATIGLNASGTLNLEAHTQFQVRTPNVWNRVAQPNQFLMLNDATNGVVEFVTPNFTNIYNNDGALSANRTVTLNSKTLTFQGFGNINMPTLGTFDVSPISRATIQSSGELALGGQTTLRIRTPKVQSKLAQVGQVLTLTDMADATQGTAEFLPVGQLAPVRSDWFAEITSPSTPTTSMFFFLNNPTNANPSYSGGPRPADYSRWVFRTKFQVVGTYGGSSVYIRLAPTTGSGGEESYPLVNAHRSNPPTGSLKDASYVEAIFIPNYDPYGPNPTNAAFIMLNTEAAGTLLTGVSVPITNSVTRAVSSLSVPGVVDTSVELQNAPLDFKKISTLGRNVIGDGGHADYYQTAYDPNVPIAEITRSTIDLNRMWRKLKP